jgi:hypothetical protein
MVINRTNYVFENNDKELITSVIGGLKNKVPTDKQKDIDHN